MKQEEYLGRHWLIEYNDCDADILKDPNKTEKILLDAANEMGATVVLSTFHHFAPLGVSGVVVIQESHLTIHTWPEYGYAAVDIFTCGKIDLEKGVDYIEKELKATGRISEKINRGKFKKN